LSQHVPEGGNETVDVLNTAGLQKGKAASRVLRDSAVISFPYPESRDDAWSVFEGQQGTGAGF
jgi:hypothetical protein